MMNFSKKQMLCIVAVLAAVIMPVGPVAAGDLVYRPLSPGLGGFSSNFDYLMGTAGAQNQFPAEGGGFPTIDFPDFNIDLGGDGTTDTTASGDGS